MVVRPPDPVKFGKFFWPDVTFYREQKLLLYSACDNEETVVKAGNELGKDFVAGYLCVYFFLTRHPCRVVTTSAKDDHLRVLWGEIGRFIRTARYPLDSRKGGPLILNHQNVGKMIDGERCPISYILGMVASQDAMAAMQGHHVADVGDGIPRTLWACDEASSVRDEYFDMVRSWAVRRFIFGNPWPCANHFYHSFKGKPGSKDTGGDILQDPPHSPTGNGPGTTPRTYHRKVFTIKAEDSPNVRYAKAEQSAGKVPSGRTLVPGVKGWQKYQGNRKTWDEVQQCVSLDGEFWEGEDVMMFPRDWLRHAAELAREQKRNRLSLRSAEAIGCDPGEGAANTALAAADRIGVLSLWRKKTPNTARIRGHIKTFAREHGLLDHSEQWLIDRGGGGKQIADELRDEGYEGVRTIGFGSTPTLELHSGIVLLDERQDTQEERYAYVNLRAEMYDRLRQLINPDGPNGGYAIPDDTPAFAELHRQLALIPRQYDSEGRIKLPPKDKRSPTDKGVTLRELLGCSPDEADAVVLAVHGVFEEVREMVAGVE